MSELSFTTEPLSVRLLDSMGDDLTVVNRARTSHGGYSEKLTSRDIRLLQYLGRGMRATQEEELRDQIMEEDDPERVMDMIRQYRTMPPHWTPFAHVQASFSITAPIPVARQWFRHEQGVTRSEVSRRYVKTTPAIHVPDFRFAPEGDIKQGSGDVMPENYAHWVSSHYLSAVSTACDTYKFMLNAGVAPEQARWVLPQGMMTTWEETGSLYYYARLLNARLRGDVQSETRVLAQQVYDRLRQIAPRSCDALIYV